MSEPAVPLVRTKVVATVGPASASRERLAELIDGGVDVFRLNFSHGQLADHERVLDLVRSLSREGDVPLAVLGDLCGPKIRLCEVEAGGFEVATGSQVRVVRGQQPCRPGMLTTTYARLLDEVDIGHRVFIDDGLVRMIVVDKTADALLCNCTVGGRLSSRKGINLPDTQLSIPAFTEKDQADLAWAIDHGLDYVALSFVRRPADLDELRRRLDERGSRIGVIVKIEKFEALEHMAELVEETDGVMVARGDLGVEMDVWQVPLIQKSITARCRDAGKPVIVATQMLQSMVANPMPTRAEVNDVANAIIDGADAVMLSAETASGLFPAAAVDMMRRISLSTEAYVAHFPPRDVPDDGVGASEITSAIARGAVQTAIHLNARVLAVWTATGLTARMLARHRVPVPIVALTDDEGVRRRLNLVYGVIPICVEPLSDPRRMASVLNAELLRRRLAAAGDLVVVVTSTRPSTPGATDTIHVHRVV
ncbi:Pyruvate kinase [Phycisphaerae bacterium RAS1]|nr:Pyruvate kinase [Phycisphaerae bacterium RAS1]